MNLKFFVVVMLSFLLVCCSSPDSEENDEQLVSTSKVLIYDNFDPDYSNPPFEDKLTILNSEGQIENTISGFNINQTIGGRRNLSVSGDGQSFVVCESAFYGNQKLSKYDISGNLVFTLNGNYAAAFILGDLIYTLTSPGTIYGDELHIIDNSGSIVKNKKIGGFDIVIDTANGAVWTVSADIKKCDLDLNVLLTIDPINWCAVSVDVNPDGSVWVAERAHPDIVDSKNRLLKISPDGTILQIIDLESDPFCVRINKSNGNFWTAGFFGIKKYDPLGNEIISITELRGWTIAIDPFDNSVWVGGWDDVRHYSSDGLQLGIYTDGFSINDQKWIGVAISN